MKLIPVCIGSRRHRPHRRADGRTWDTFAPAYADRETSAQSREVVFMVLTQGVVAKMAILQQRDACYRL